MCKRSKEVPRVSGSERPPSNQSAADQPEASDVKHFLSLGSKVSPRPC